MCIGYAKEISAWVCDEARSQREVMMDAWSRAFEDADDESESSGGVLPPHSAAPAIDFQEQTPLSSPRTACAT